jgi:uncharacterized protein DUF3892
MRKTSVLEIVAARLERGDGPERITDLMWQGASSSGLTTSEGLIAWLREDPEHEAWLMAGERRVAVEVVTPIGAPSHLRSRHDGKWGDQLLALPRF